MLGHDRVNCFCLRQGGNLDPLFFESLLQNRLITGIRREISRPKDIVATRPKALDSTSPNTGIEQ